MKTILAGIFLLCIIPSCSYCQAVQSAVAEIKKLEDQERMAAMAGDTAKLFALRSDDYTVNNPNNMILTAAQIKSYARGTGMDKTSFTRNIEKISFAADVAVVMGSETVTPKDKNGNDLKSVYRRYTHVWIKTGNTWKLFARQATNTLIQ